MMRPEQNLSMNEALVALRAAGEETRLRILALLSAGELSVSDLTDILGQSQPRISRHLKLLVESGLVERHREGAWAFFRLADRATATQLLHPLLDALDGADRHIAADKARLQAKRRQRAEAAQAYFARIAPKWDELRSLHAAECDVEKAVAEVIGEKPVLNLIDLGTGTGRMLGRLAPLARRAVGLDASHAMLSVARANLEKAGVGRVELRQGDIHAPPVEENAFDLVIIHQVLHYLDDPARALREAARLVSPGGRMLIVDFAPHGLEFLREKQAHRRLGFSHEQIGDWLDEAGLDCAFTRDLPPPEGIRDALTVSIWLGQDRRVRTDWPVQSKNREVA
ncbi:MAG TPA: metalloregulator ArsR/SmtB family transcription factor [Saliniramus sp.]|nr:metalloregulator ArsR/SmtB family transcription factor [Saliniramus sp.]HMB12213.1 metalloregulator ArsR/SmtB family transcription factor [Saliniramus sp.]